MDIETIRAKLTEIEHVVATDDDEWAHVLQDNLWMEALAAIADGEVRGATVREFAAEALKVRKIDFVRLY